MIEYFKTLLKTLQDINERLDKLEKKLDDVSADSIHSNQRYIKTGHWNNGV